MRLLIILFSLMGLSFAANILVMLPMPMYSHTTNFMTVFKELAKRGHNVTCVSPFPQKTALKNWNDITVKNTLADLMAQIGPLNLLDMDSMLFILIFFWKMCERLAEIALEQEPVQRIIQDTTSSYDLIITETFFAHEPFLALGHKYNAPVINVNSFGLTPTIAFFTGNHYPTSYVPNYSFPSSDKMSFYERMTNSFLYMWYTYVYELYYLNQVDFLIKKYFNYPGSENIPPVAELARNTSLTLLETHIGLHYPQPLQKNMVEVGGINLHDGDKLPDDLQQFMDNAPEGVIYFSFGSHFNTSLLSESVQNSIISAFSKVKQKVIMKWDKNIGKNENIYTGKWFPQASILGHSKCKIFITHGGVHGVTEGLFHGVPLIGMPIFADQKFNIKFVEEHGAGINLELNKVTEDQLLQAINTILTDKRYKENAQLRKSILRENPVSQLENAIYWIEYVIKFKGARHLRPTLLDLSWFQGFLIDITLAFIGLTLVFFFILFIMIKYTVKLLKCMFRSKNDNKKSKKE
ncbi:UDP-glucuronosyltransferase 2B4-like [Cimex lectularius]|uniref:UDP-glucuronosyltransferase n=1 Tax=Cimex lectularius TaxID=79782 RepID=A0A8I6RRB5_CIMLE|nr:UDP-glucuronosyltransferase 2B4-like [Cimex lectularius]XP_014251071.1 UDP-glucuronosyltransferase 2B4-like [Cimex lectularius]